MRRTASGASSAISAAARRSSVRRRSSGVSAADLHAAAALRASNMWTGTRARNPLRHYVAPLLLVLLAPAFLVVLHHTNAELDGSTRKLWLEFRARGFISGVLEMWPDWRNPVIWKSIAIFCLLQLLLSRLLPGKTHKATLTPAGNIPEYKINGLLAFLSTHFLNALCIYMRFYRGSLLFDNLSKIVASTNVLGFALCLLLYLKGFIYPSSTDSGSTHNPVFDFYWGMELHPRIMGCHVKQFVVGRLGVMFWSLLLVSALLKQREIYHTMSDGLLVSVALQLVYICKFFVWESGYLNSLSIGHDRAGFYLVWGSLVFLPIVYPLHTVYMVTHPARLGAPLGLGLLGAGLACIYLNYDMDRQRQQVRAAKGLCKVWARDPYFITAKYTTANGEAKHNVLLCSGWWGMARHFHYVPEIGAAICWTIPVWTRQFLPYFYIMFLPILLLDRAYRDDARCRAKYGKHWDHYCRLVPSRLLPSIF